MGVETSIKMARKAMQFNLRFRDFGLEVGFCPISQFRSSRRLKYIEALCEEGNSVLFHYAAEVLLTARNSINSRVRKTDAAAKYVAVAAKMVPPSATAF